MTDKQLSDKLEAIRNEIAVPAEDLKNIKWVRNFLRKASTVEGEDLGEKKESRANSNRSYAVEPFALRGVTTSLWETLVPLVGTRLGVLGLGLKVDLLGF